MALSMQLRNIAIDSYRFDLSPHPVRVTVTTRIITFLVGNPYKPSFVTGILGGGRGRSKLQVGKYLKKSGWK